MSLYIYLLLSTQIVSILDRFRNAKQSNKLLFFLFVQMLLVSALRAKSVGADTANYVNIFMTSAYTGGRMLLIAPVYYGCLYIIHAIFPFEQAYIIFTSLVSFVCIYYFIKFFSDDKYMSLYAYIALGFYFASFNTARQSVALSLLLVAFIFIYSGKTKLASFFALSGCLCHISVVLMLPFLYTFHYKRISSKLFWAVIVASLIVCVCFSFLLNIFLELFPSYSMYVGGDNTLGFKEKGQGAIFFVYLFCLLVAMFSVYTAFLLKGRTKLKDKLNLFSLPVAFSSVIGFMNTTEPLFYRMSLNLSIFIIILIPCALSAYGRKGRFLLHVIFIIALFIPFYFKIVRNHDGILPYTLFFLK